MFLGSIPVVSLGFFFVASDNSMCPGSTQTLNMSTGIILGVKTAGDIADNLPPSSADVTESGSINLPGPSAPHRTVFGRLYLYNICLRPFLLIFLILNVHRNCKR
jgi:hypothetical protein